MDANSNTIAEDADNGIVTLHLQAIDDTHVESCSHNICKLTLVLIEFVHACTIFEKQPGPICHVRSSLTRQPRFYGEICDFVSLQYYKVHF